MYQCGSAYFVTGMFIFSHAHTFLPNPLSVLAYAVVFLQDIGSLFLTLMTFFLLLALKDLFPVIAGGGTREE